MAVLASVAITTAWLAGCGTDAVTPIEIAQPGVLFSYPHEGQLDVPLGARIVVTFSDPVVASAIGACTQAGSGITGGACLVGPDGPLATTATVSPDGTSVIFSGAPLAENTIYAVYVGATLSPTSTNLPTAGHALITFTTRASRPRAGAPTLVAVDGAPVAEVASTPLDQTTTIRLLFSEPLDPRTVTYAPGSVQLLDASGSAVDATVLTDGIHISIDPNVDLTAGATYKVELGAMLADPSGSAFVATSVSLTPSNSMGSDGPITESLRTRQAGDPGPANTRSGAIPNQISIDKPLIGNQTVIVKPVTIKSELGDASALDGPIAFTIRRGQRLASSGLDIALGGVIPAGLNTGDVYFEFASDSGGRLYRNPFQPASIDPDNARSPVYVDLTFDVAIFAVDPTGNAVLAQTVLGVQATGTAIATDGVLDIEAIASLDLALLGVTSAPSNLVLELITDPSATVPADTTPPTFIASFPADAASDHPVGDGIDLVFSEPIDLDRARNGGVVLADGTGKVIPMEIESHGSAIVVRPLAPLTYSTAYAITMPDVADVAGNGLTGTNGISFTTPKLVATNVPITVVAVTPGAPCSLGGATAMSPGRCTSGQGGDDLYQPFTLAANQPVHVDFSGPVLARTLVLGTACNAGSVRIEQLDSTGACTGVVAGSLDVHDRSFDFVPDVAWPVGGRYRLTLVSGGNASCDAGELCGYDNVAASFDPLAGTTNSGAGGPNLVMPFTVTAATDDVAMVALAAPYTDANASGFVEGGETPQPSNSAQLHVNGTSGIVSAANFEGNDCSGVSSGDGCLYLLGAMPVILGALQTNCTLPDGTVAANCIPVTVSAQAMYATSSTLDATAAHIAPISSATGTTIMRIRAPKDGNVTGFIVDGGSGTPTMVVALDLYMDAPDLDVTASSNDLQSKQMSVSLSGPVTFLPDGRIAINLASTADVPVTINIVAIDIFDGGVDLVVPAGDMKLQLLSPALRGGPP